MMVGVTLRRFSTDRENPQICDSGIIIMHFGFIVAESLKMRRGKMKKKDQSVWIEVDEIPNKIANEDKLLIPHHKFIKIKQKGG